MKKPVIYFLLISILLLGICGCSKQAEIQISNGFAPDVIIQSFVIISKPIPEIREECGPLDLNVLIKPNLVEEFNRSGQSFSYALSAETVENGPSASVIISLSHGNGGWREGYYFQEVRVTDLISILLLEEDGVISATLKYADGTTQVKEGFMFFIT